MRHTFETADVLVRDLTATCDRTDVRIISEGELLDEAAPPKQQQMPPAFGGNGCD